MSTSNILSTIQTHLVTAGNAQTDPIKQVLSGEPIMLSNVPVLAYWLIPITKWESDTFSKTQRILGVHWEAYFPGSQPTNTVALSTELRIAEIVFAVEAQLMGDVNLGGYATGGGLAITDAIPGWTDFAGVLCRSVGQDIHVYLANVADISA